MSLNKRKGKFSSQLIFSNAISQSQAITAAYNMGTEDNISQVEVQLRDVIGISFHESKKISWAPTASYLESLHDVVPSELKRFLKTVLSGKDDLENIRLSRLVLSIGQDICRAATLESGQYQSTF